MAKTELANAFNEKIAIGMLGTQLFWFNETTGVLDYAIPITDDGGGEYGGDIESFEAPEADLLKTPKISGRQTLDDVTYTTNYTADRYKRWGEILDATVPHTFVEVYKDLSAHIVRGTGQYTARQGDPRTIEATLAPENMGWVENVLKVKAAEFALVKSMFKKTDGSYMDFSGVSETPGSLKFNLDSIPENRESPVEDGSADL